MSLYLLISPPPLSRSSGLYPLDLVFDVKRCNERKFAHCSHARFSNGDYTSSVEAYEKALELDPSNANVKSSLAQAKSKVDASVPRQSDRSASTPPAGAGGMPDLAGLASMMGGLGGGGGGGMPDLASMMRNPQMMAM